MAGVGGEGRAAPRLLAALLLVVGVGVGFWLRDGAGTGRPGGTPRGASAPEASETPDSAAPRDEDGRFPLQAARRMLALLEAPERVGFSKDGRVVHGDAVAEEDLGLFDLEPLTYGARLRALPGYGEILDWVEAGGDGRSLSPRDEEVVEAIDARFHEAGLLRPLRVYLRARPSRTGGEVPPLKGVYQVGRVGPWGHAATLAMRRVLRSVPIMDEQLDTEPQAALNMSIPSSLRIFQLGKAREILRSVGRSVPGRVRLAAFTRRAVEDSWLALVLVARSIRHEPETAGVLASAFAGGFHDSRTIYFSEIPSLSPRQLCGMRVVDPALGAVVGEVLENSVDRPALSREQVEERLAAAIRILRVGMGPGEGRAARHRRAHARDRLVRLLSHREREVELRELWEEMRPLVQQEPPQMDRGSLCEMADYVSKFRPGEDPARDEWARQVEAGLTRWLAANPTGDDGGGRGRRLLERLRKAQGLSHAGG